MAHSLTARLYYDHVGHESKAFHVLDGQGLKQLEHCGIRVTLITALASLAAKTRRRPRTPDKNRRARQTFSGTNTGNGIRNRYGRRVIHGR